MVFVVENFDVALKTSNALIRIFEFTLGLCLRFVNELFQLARPVSKVIVPLSVQLSLS